MAVKKNQESKNNKKAQEYPLIKIELIKSLIGRTAKQRAAVQGLGLTRINSKVVREKRPEILGMIEKVNFLLKVTDVESVV